METFFTKVILVFGAEIASFHLRVIFTLSHNDLLAPLFSNVLKILEKLYHYRLPCKIRISVQNQGKRKQFTAGI